MNSLQKDQAQYLKMTQTPIPRLISSLAVPTVISMLVTAVYNTADTFFVAMLNDTSATGAVSVVFSLMALMQATSFAIGMGSGSWISRLLGQQKNEEANEVGSSGLVMALAFGSLLFLYGLFCDTTPLMKLIGATDTIAPYAKRYATFILCGAPLMMGSFVLNNLLRAEGKAKFSAIGIAFGGILNVFLDPIFILPWGLDLKTAGAALATAISQAVSFFILLVPFLRGKTAVKLHPKYISRRALRYVTIFKNGVPSLARQGLSSISSILLNIGAAAAAGAFADQAIAAMGIVTKVTMMVFSVVIGIGQGYQPVLGYNYGAKRFDRAREAMYFMAKACTLVITAFSVLCFIAAPWVIGIFGSAKSDADVMRFALFAFRAQCVSLPLVPMGVTANMTFQSTGQALRATFLSSCRQGIFLVPLLLILPYTVGITGVLIAQPIADALTFIVCVPFLWKFARELKAAEERENTQEQPET